MSNTIIFVATVAALMGSLLVDSFSFGLHTLPNFLRQAKNLENPANPNFATMAAVLKDMQSLGLTLEGPLEDEKPAVAGNPHPDDRDTTTTTGPPTPKGHRPDQPVQVISKRTKITDNPENPDFATIRMVLKDMQSLGLTLEGAIKDEKPATTAILHAESRDTTKLAA